MPDFETILQRTQANVAAYPIIGDELARILGLPSTVLAGSDLGFYPAEQAWVVPERDAAGRAIGLLKRYSNGKKMTWKGSKRGLSYESVNVQQEGGDAGGRQFVRVSDAGVPCPICGREADGCLVSDENPSDPAAVICVRTPGGASRALPSGAGYLHHRKQLDRPNRGQLQSILPVSDSPVVVTEGWSDRMAAKALGYVTVSRPSADACTSDLADLVRGRSVILVGDRDPHGVGQRGLEAAYQVLLPVCTSIVKVLPPEGYKDLRQWYIGGLTREQFEAHVSGAGVDAPSERLLEGSSPYDMVQEWLGKTQTKDGRRLFHHVNGDYYKWSGGLYRMMDQREIRREWYEFFANREIKTQQAKSVKISTVWTDKKLMGNLDDAASALCYVRVEDGVHEPFLIETGRNVDLTRAVIFQNGILSVDDGSMAPLSPRIFLTSTLPYDYHPGLTCPTWDWFVPNIFNRDMECHDLLQEWFGYNMIASNHMQTMMFFFGVPGSGKSTTGNILRAVLGNARACAVGTENFTGQFGRAKLVGKYAAIMSESRGTNKSDIDKLLQSWKAMTGGDVMDVRAMYRPHADARLFCRLTYIANDAIQFDDASQAMANRLLLLYFPNNYRKLGPDWNLEDRLRAEAPGIALWALQGLRRLLKNGQFTRPRASMKHLAALAELTNPIGMMLKECCEIHTGPEFTKHCVPCSDLYDLWRVWSERNNVRLALNSISFGMKLGNMDLPIVKRQMTEHKKRFYVYQGLSFQPGIMEKYLMR